MTTFRSAVQATRTNHPAGLTAAAVAIFTVLAGVVGAELPAELAAALVGVATALASFATPRFDGARAVGRSILAHPTGLAAAVAAALVAAADAAGLTLTPDLAVAVVACVATLISFVFPRFDATELVGNYPPAGGTGPDADATP